MTVIHVLLGFKEGGVASVVKNLLLAQAKSTGINLAVVTNPNDLRVVEEWAKKNRIQVKGYSSKNSQRPALYGCVSSSTIKAVECDFAGQPIVWHFHNPATYGLLQSQKFENVICTLHGYNVSSSNISHWIFRATIKKIFNQGGQVVGCCHKLSEYYMESIKLSPAHKIQTVLNGTACVGPEEPLIDAPRNKIIIGYLSYIDELKGWRILAEAYLALPEKERDKTEIYFAGQVAPSEQEAFAKFIDNHNVHYLGYVKNAAARFMPYIDFLALPSKSEGLPMAILEALQAGTPVLASPVGGIPEAVVEGVSGYLVQRSVTQWANMLHKVIQNDDCREKWYDKVKFFYQNNFTNNLMADNYMKIYNKLLEEVT